MTLPSLLCIGQLPARANNVAESRYATVLLSIPLCLLVSNRKFLLGLFILFFLFISSLSFWLICKRYLHKLDMNYTTSGHKYVTD